MEIQTNTIYQEIWLETLARMPDGFIDNCITSPPYYQKRDYKDPRQLGMEKTPEEFISKLVAGFREVRRAMADDGTLWVNIGDSYFSGKQSGPQGKNGDRANRTFTAMGAGANFRIQGLKPKDLIGIPWMLAFALRADGWYLRQEIIWAKPNPMPESVTDRCTASHESIFLFSKSEKYYFDHEAIKEPMADASVLRLAQNLDGQNGSDRVPGKTNGNMKAVGPRFGGNKYGDDPEHPTKSGNVYEPNGTRNKRDVWTVSTKGFKGAHFAVMPQELIEPCVLTTKPDAIIYDPFGGSGTTAVVALRAGRQYILSEINPDYAAMATNRIAPYQNMMFAALG